METTVKFSFHTDKHYYSKVITLPPEEIKNLDKILDSEFSNMKVKLLFHIREGYPEIWYQDSPLDLNELNKLIICQDK